MKSEFLDKSICVNCEYLNKRLIGIRNLSSFLDDLGISLDEEEDDFHEDNADTVLESFICKCLHIELEDYVLECEDYNKKLKKNIMKNKRILNDLP